MDRMNPGHNDLELSTSLVSKKYYTLPDIGYQFHYHFPKYRLRHQNA